MEDLRELVDYDPATGALTWRARLGQSRGVKSFNARYAGRPALACHDRANGYLIGIINGKSAKAHRIIYEWMTGEKPIQVDHINGIGTDNRWCNLRNVTNQENSRNARRRKIKRDLPSGVQVSGPYYQVQIETSAGRYHGSYRTLEDAAEKARQVYEAFGYTRDHGANA